jgi:hypothetical protein
MTPDGIIKQLEAFAALQEKATPGPWSVVERFGVQCGDGSRLNTSDLNNGDFITASRSIPAAEAAATMREMVEELSWLEWTGRITDGGFIYSACPRCHGIHPSCVVLPRSVGKYRLGHASNCRLAKLIGDKK